MPINHVNLIENYLGILALTCSITAFSPIIINWLRLPKYRKKLSLKIAQISLFLTIFLGFIHGLLTTQIEAIDFYSWKTYWLYAEGVITFNLLLGFAFCFTELKLDSKKLAYFTYAAIVLLACHVWGKVL